MNIKAVFWRLYYTCCSFLPGYMPPAQSDPPIVQKTNASEKIYDVEDLPGAGDLSYDELWAGQLAVHFVVNVSVIWDVDTYDAELTSVARAESPEQERLHATYLRHSKSHTTFEGYELMSFQADQIKGQLEGAEKAVEVFVEQLKIEIPELIAGREYQAIDVWWFNEDESQTRLRHLPASEETHPSEEVP